MEYTPKIGDHVQENTIPSLVHFNDKYRKEQGSKSWLWDHNDPFLMHNNLARCQTAMGQINQMRVDTTADKATMMVVSPPMNLEGRRLTEFPVSQWLSQVKLHFCPCMHHCWMWSSTSSLPAQPEWVTASTGHAVCPAYRSMGWRPRPEPLGMHSVQKQPIVTVP